MKPTPRPTFRPLRRSRGDDRQARLLILRPADGAGDAVIATRTRLSHRLRAWLRASSLDSQLAAGVPPAASAALSLRAHELGQPRNRTLIGEQLLRILCQAQGPRRLTRARLQPQRAEVLAAADELEELARRLLAPGPLAAHGLAQARTLLVDGRSPLYFAGATERLATATARALEALHPSFGW